MVPQSYLESETLGRLKNTTESIQAELASELAGQGSASRAAGYCQILDPNAGTSQYTPRARFSPAKLPRPSACTNHNVDGPEDRSHVDVTPAWTRPRDFSTWTPRLVHTIWVKFVEAWQSSSFVEEILQADDATTTKSAAQCRGHGRVGECGATTTSRCRRSARGSTGSDSNAYFGSFTVKAAGTRAWESKHTLLVKAA